MRDSLVVIPLIILLTLSLFSLFYLGTGELGTGYVMTINNPEGFPYMYDYTGRAIAHFGNFTGVEEPIAWREFYYEDGIEMPVDYYAIWRNTTTWFWVNNGYYAYYTPDGNISLINPIPITTQEYEDFNNAFLNQNTGYTLTADYSSSYGIIALAIALLVVVAVIGFNVVGSGENESSTKFLITGISLLAIWGVFSVISLLQLSLVPYGLGAIFYFALTAFYCLGIFMKGTE